MFASLVNFFINFGLYVTMVVVVDYATVALGASMSLAGFASGAFILGALIARLVIGERVERIGTRRVLLAGLVVYAAAFAFLPTSISRPSWGSSPCALCRESASVSRRQAWEPSSPRLSRTPGRARA